MRQDDFQARHEHQWAALDAWLERRARPPRSERSLDAPETIGDLEFPAMYRRVCQHLSIAERRGYSDVVVARLRDLVHRGHLVLYQPPPPRLSRVLEFVAVEFPRLVRAHAGAMTISALLLFGPMLATIAVLQVRPELVHSVFDAPQLAELERMYDPAAADAKLGRESGTDLKMFGHYVLNNVSIGFRTFASGLLAGVGPTLVLLLNGTMIGAAAGHLTAIGHGGPFWRFVVGHSAPELIAIVIAGAAGLTVGMALIAPGRRTRGRALAEAGANGARLVLGAFVMLVFAAFIEAYWSSIGSLPDAVKFGSGALIWVGVLSWLTLGGRAR